MIRSLADLLSPKKTSKESGWRREVSSDGVSLSLGTPGTRLGSSIVSAFIAQLVDDGLAVDLRDGVFISWTAFYAALRSPGYEELAAALELPSFTSRRPSLVSKGSLTDPDFSIALAAWLSPSAHPITPKLSGALLSLGDLTELMRPEHWDLVSEVTQFARRDSALNSDVCHRSAWGRIRRFALLADAQMDDFLHRSVVLTPERLSIELRSSQPLSGDKLIEIAPSFEGAPPDWLNHFDRAKEVRDRYDIATPDGVVQVQITPAVKDVLQEIKRLPLRRVAGSRAQTFIVNPYAAFGPSAGDVIDSEQFEIARAAAGLEYERFSPSIPRDQSGKPTAIGLLIETASSESLSTSETVWLNDAELDDFIRRLETAIEQNFPLLGWNGYDLELLADTADHLTSLKDARDERQKPTTLISYDAVHDLSAYSARVQGIGVEKPYYSPYIAKKKDDEGWFPDNVLPLITYVPEGSDVQVAIPASGESLKELRGAVEQTKAAGHESVAMSWLPAPMPLAEAEHVLSTFEEVLQDVKKGTFNPTERESTHGSPPPRGKTLILRSNIQQLDYAENRRDALLALPSEPLLPASLNPEYSLLPHQRDGLAWLQHLHHIRAPFQVKGAVLADDMGLGKTLQLLAFMAWLVENDARVDPMLVVAPLSLLENWKEEAEKFIQPGILPILTAHGEGLAPFRVSKEQIDLRLRNEDGLVKFLKPGWVGSAKLVLTTYETLRDLEFSFAAERWSVMVCDEAQRIKNPAAMVTRSAKKQKIGFKVACTGTPVENTLADLWCLFDFIQPGLLGALNEFGERYRKPIEARNDEDRARVEELRALIAPQILRRTKADVAKDLPAKIIVESCRNLRLSNAQRSFYAKAIDDFKKRNEPGSSVPFKNHLGLLQYLRLICTDPRHYGLTAAKPEPLLDYREKAPKIDWLLSLLREIKGKDEKAIVFCEFRNIQRLLQHYIEEVFKIRADIINGDTATASNQSASRQGRIRNFQKQPGFGVIILSPIAVGFGVNIQAANHVIHYTRTWNPAKEDQATDRAYRIGQTKDVFVYYPVVTATDFATFDVKLDQLLTKKRELANDMLNGSGDLAPGDFNIADVIPSAAASGLDDIIDLDTALNMQWRYFEGLAAALWTRQGYSFCYCTPQSGDLGVDVVAILGDKGVLIQTKTSAQAGTKLGWETVKDVSTGAAHYQKQHPHVDFRKIGLTNQFFNTSAHEQALLNGVELIDQNGLAQLLEHFPVSMLEVERILFSEWEG